MVLVQGLSSLRRLDLSGNCIGRLESLAPVQAATLLSELNISANALQQVRCDFNDYACEGHSVGYLRGCCTSGWTRRRALWARADVRLTAQTNFGHARQCVCCTSRSAAFLIVCKRVAISCIAQLLWQPDCLWWPSSTLKLGVTNPR